MVYNSYVVYQSMEAALAVWEAVELLPESCINFTNVHYISDEAAAANLELARLKAAVSHINPSQ